MWFPAALLGRRLFRHALALGAGLALVAAGLSAVKKQKAAAKQAEQDFAGDAALARKALMEGML